MNNISTTIICFLIFCSAVITSAQNGQIDSTYGNYGKQNYADFHPYLYSIEEITKLPQSEESFLLLGNIISKDDDGKMWLPVSTFKNDYLVSEKQMPLSETQQNFNLKCAIASTAGYASRFVIAGGRNGNLFLKQFEVDGTPVDNFGIHSEVVRDLGSDDYVSSMVRLFDRTYVVFARTKNKIVCLKLDDAGEWDPSFGVGGKLEFPVSGDFKVYSTITSHNDIYFTTGIQQLRKMNQYGVEDLEFFSLANQYADLKVSSMQIMDDGNLLLGGNELFSPKSLILLKLTPDGSPVNSFGNQGKTLINYQGNFNTINSVRIFKNRIFVVGGIDLNFFVAKVSIDGLLVPEFGVDGIVKIKYGNSITTCLDINLNNNGTALLMGSREGWLATARIKSGALPTVNASISAEFVCPGDIFQLSATGADSYHWVGSDGFESFIANPTISINDTFSGADVLYTVTGQNADGFSDEAQTAVFLKNDIEFSYTEKLPCFGSEAGHLVKILKGSNFDSNIQLNYNPAFATKVSEDDESVIMAFNFAASPLELSFNDSEARYCPKTLSVDFRTHEAILATLEVNSIDSTCIGVINPFDESDPLTYLWTNSSTGKISAGLSAGPFEVTITNTVTGCTATFGAECAPVLSSDNLQNSINAIFPNPTSDEVSVVLDKSFNDASLMTFMDSQGKIIVIQKLNNQANGIYKINVGEFSAGLYFVKVQNTENKLFTGKFIKISN